MVTNELTREKEQYREKYRDIFRYHYKRRKNSYHRLKAKFALILLLEIRDNKEYFVRNKERNAREL